MTEPIVIIIGGMVVPKERPRVEGKKAHYSEGYTQWQKSAKLALQASIAALPAMITQHFPLSKVRIEVEFHGALNTIADADNGTGSWMDAMVRAGILLGDNVQKVNQIGGKYFEHDHPVSAIIIYPNWTPVSVIDPKLLEAPDIPKTVKVVKKRAVKTASKTASKIASKTTETVPKKPKLTLVRSPLK